MQLIKQGAEAKLFKIKYKGKGALLKQRVPKGYRCRALDERLRSERTIREANLLRRARQLGVNTPSIYSVDKGKKEILMEFVDGPRAKDALNKKNYAKICSDVGKAIALMHGSNIIHGDLTTSNILQREGRLYFIDFGLGFHSTKLEDKAVDLLVFRKTFEATHVELMPKGWESIMQGYLQAGGNPAVVKQMEKVRARARYH